MVLTLSLTADAREGARRPADLRPTCETCGATRELSTKKALASEGLVAALDQLGVPAFVADAHGRPAYTNALGAKLFERDPSRTTQRLRSRIRRGSDVREIRAPGVRPHWLVMLSREAVGPVDRVAAAARAWKLTARQVEVLRLVVTGEANKSIAVKLGCAEVTVEFHLTSLFRKARVENRAQLVSRFWTL
jgi:DNA-binding CsgD family transcriptional regulator